MVGPLVYHAKRKSTADGWMPRERCSGCATRLDALNFGV